MRGGPVVTDASASLLEADPELALAMGPHAAAELGHEAILPVLSVPAGRWEPPARSELGAAVVALVVLDGLMAAGTPAIVIGPGDVLEPWESGVTWTACTPARLALIGTRFMEAVRPWPGAAAHLLARAWGGSTPAESRGTVDEVLLDVLWRIAGRWGVPRFDALELPRALDVEVVAALLEVPATKVAAAAARLAARGALVRREGEAWLLRTAPPGPATGHSRARRDGLRSRSAHQLALAREIGAQSLALSERTAAQLEAGRQRRGP